MKSLLQNTNPLINSKLISRKEFEEILLNKFGLKLELKSICKYVDKYSCNRHVYNYSEPKVFTIGFIDKTGFSWSNINGFFYNEHASKQTELYKEFKEFKNSHTFKIQNHFFI